MFKVIITQKVGESPRFKFVKTEEEAWSAVTKALKEGAYKATFERV